MNNIQYFKNWNWESDIGEGPIEDEESLPKSYCEVRLDHRGNVFRVIRYGSDDFIILDVDCDDEKIVYDYYCDNLGRVLEKRSLDDAGNVVLIVQYEYIKEKKTAEVAWNPNSSEAPNRVVF